MARIKAINTFFAKNGYRSMDSSMYAQQSQTQSQYNSALYMQHVYPQQQYSLYGVVPPTWTPSPTPYFETPLAPFPNSGFVNGFSSPGHYKTASSSLNISRPFTRNRNHVKPQPQVRPSEVAPAPVAPVPLESLTSSLTRSPQPSVAPSPMPPPADLTSTAFPHLSTSDTSDDGGMAGRGRRGTYRSTRRRREDERIPRPVPLAEVKVPPPKFDLAATNFPPLPGCVVSTQGETVLETRMSDVVRGLNRDKTEQAHKEASVSAGPAPEEAASVPVPALPAVKPAVQPHGPSAPSVTHQEKRVERAEPPAPKVTHPTPAPSAANPSPSTQPTPGPKAQPSAPTTPVTPSTPVTTTTTAAATTTTNTTPTTPTPALEPRKLSYAEVCQRPPKDPPAPAPCASAPSQASSSSSSSSSSGNASGQPLRELRVNKAEEPGSSSSSGSQGGDRQEKAHDREGGWECKESRPHHRSSDSQGGYYRSNGPRGAGGLKFREQRRPPPTQRNSPQGGGGPRHTGKEQNIPPISPK